MSLINDALKRAKQAQQENPPTTPPLEFRPVEPAQGESRRPTLLVVALSLVVVSILGLAGLLVCFVTQSSQSPLPVAARMADAPVPPSVPPPVEPARAPQPVVPPPAGEVAEHPDEPDTNGVPVGAALVEALPPPALKLQGIFFNPNNPSAVVNGRTVYLGDRVNGFRLVAVSPVAATFASATETNVLSLSEP
jgi:hypothetical protein